MRALLVLLGLVAAPAAFPAPGAPAPPTAPATEPPHEERALTLDAAVDLV
ncbi:MAG: hypothetical protein JSR54_18695, partial [Proteobacteria bacterium]|nr:hypothetical protein [Pseudomonadota bacterium]